MSCCRRSRCGTHLDWESDLPPYLEGGCYISNIIARSRAVAGQVRALRPLDQKRTVRHRLSRNFNLREWLVLGAAVDRSCAVDRRRGHCWVVVRHGSYATTGIHGRVTFSAKKSTTALMARQTAYFVQTFDTGRGGHLKPDSPIACKSASGAFRTAEKLALSKFAVVAYSSTRDPEMGDYDDQLVFFRKGQLPEAFD
jgi:hypothetical protein